MEEAEEPLLDDRAADYLDRLDRMQAQDTEAVRMKTRLRQLEARKLALRQRMLEAKPLAEFGGPELGSFGSDANRVALAMEIQEANVMTSGEIMLRFGKTVGENAAAMAAFTALGFALPEKASRDLNIVMDGAAVAALISGVDPVFAAVRALEGAERAGEAAEVRHRVGPGPRQELRLRPGRRALARVRAAAREVARGLRRAGQRPGSRLRRPHVYEGVAKRQDRAALCAPHRYPARVGL